MSNQEILNQELQEFKKDVLIFNPDPEQNSSYFSIFKDGKLIGRSNHGAAIYRFLLNLKESGTNTDGYTICFDGDETSHPLNMDEYISGNLETLSSMYLRKLDF